MSGGAVVIGYDGSPAADRAITESAALLTCRQALVVVVWDPAVVLPMTDLTLAPAPIDTRATVDIDQASQEHARRLAGHGAVLARGSGLDAEGLTVADEVSVADTLLRLAAEREAPAIVVGAHGHGRVHDLVLGSTAQALIRHARCPVVVVRDLEGE